MSTEDAAQTTGLCPSGGVNPSSQNPIALLSGAKLMTVTDWQTADGRLAVTRHYNSFAQGNGSIADNGYVIGSKWGLSFQP